MPVVDHATALLDEPSARRILLVRAIETADVHGKLLSDAERTQSEQAVLARLNPGGHTAPEPAAYLAARAAALLQAVEARSPALARLEARDPWWDRLGTLLPALALLAGFSSDRLFNWSRTDLLSPPLIGVIAWNFGVYLLLVVSAFRGGGPTGFLRGLAELPSWFSRRAVARARDSAQLQFRLLWWQAAGALEGARLHKLMHLSAAAWALGVVLSIAITGLTTRFHVGWESTWLNAEGVHRVVAVMALPAQALGIEGFTREQVRQLEFAPGAVAAQAIAQRWALIYIVFLMATVVLPRLLLWALARYRERVAGRRLRLDLADDYFNGVLARVRTARLLVSLRGPDSPLKEAAHAVLALAAADAPLATPQGDRLEIDRAGLPADAVWLVIPPGMAGVDALAALRGIAPVQPVLVLCERADEVAALREQLGTEVLALAACGACWAVERPLQQWLVQHVSAHKRPGVERLAAAWAAAQADRWAASLQLLGGVLAESASDSQDTTARLPGEKDREAAVAQLLARLQQRLDILHPALAQLHGVQAGVVRQPVGQGTPRLLGMGQAGAGAAGAVAGALAGAKIDLLTGGLSMGAGLAIGAALGGAGVFSAARWWLFGGAARLGDEQVLNLAELLVLQYLAVIHAGRALDMGNTDMAAAWKSETVAAVATESAAFKRAVKQLRSAAPGAEAELRELLRRVTRQVLGRLYGIDALSIQ